jgi:putative transposase
MLRTHKYCLWTNDNQNRELGIMLESHRRLYNACLDQRKTTYETEKRSIKYGEQSSWYKSQRAINPYFAKLNFSSAQATMRRLDKAFVAFFRRIKNGRIKTREKSGYPRFKPADRFSSIEFPTQGDGIRLTRNRLRIQHVGVVKVCLHRPLPDDAQIRTLTVTREADKWYLEVCFKLLDQEIEPSTLPAVGLDVGIEYFLTTSDGEHIPNPGYLKSALPELRRSQRALSRKKKGGSNRAKAKIKVRELHARVKNLRSDHRHKSTLDLTRRYGCIAVESLNVKGMLGNRRMSRAISDVAWSAFITTLTHKAESAGATMVQVSPQGTSQECSGCGQTVQKKLSERWYNCPHCGLSLQRDVNAARNILIRAMSTHAFASPGSGEWDVTVLKQGAVFQEAVCFS